ncbi:hypothetical protein E4U42_000102 [Claviceps africana]|uniref:Uncharacterized protein n=1 Tax=Claviceps africana TaxID=83212 RepID=A0A8K0NET7_9HYPO|nr:hypothetical protein E4U42_000102 [Claviceps africana]
MASTFSTCCQEALASLLAVLRQQRASMLMTENLGRNEWFLANIIGRSKPYQRGSHEIGSSPDQRRTLSGIHRTEP